MTRYAIIQGGVVVNVIEASAAFVAGLGGTAVVSNTAGPGDTWDGTSFTRATPAVIVPQTVTMAQACIALGRAGIAESDVDAVIAGLPAGPIRNEAASWWKRSNEVHRRHPFVLQLAPYLGLTTDAQLDALFIAAAAV